MQTLKFIWLVLLVIACNSTKNKDNTNSEEFSLDTTDVVVTLNNQDSLKVDSFLVTNNSVGIFKKGMTIKDIVQLLPEKQIRKKIGHGEFQNDNYDNYEIYDDNNLHLLSLSPLVQNDSNSIINRVLIIDNRFKTKSGIGIESSYSDLVQSYTTIVYTPDLEHIVLTVDQLGAWFSIKKEVLKEGWWNEKTKKIDKSKIPLNARFDSFIIWWK